MLRMPFPSKISHGNQFLNVIYVIIYLQIQMTSSISHAIAIYIYIYLPFRFVLKMLLCEISFNSDDYQQLYTDHC